MELMVSAVPQTSKKEYRKLCDEIWEHNYHYYVENDPLISDRQFDALLARVAEIEEQHPDWVFPGSPTQRVGETVTGKFPLIKHTFPMLSLANTYSPQEVEEFIARMHKALQKKEVLFEVELKMDGIAVSVRYEEGLLVRAVTRGNGKEGDEITSNIRTISSLPLELRGRPPRVLEARGEVYMPKKVFEALNRQREAEGEEPFANPRNAAGGSLKLLDPREVARRKLAIAFYAVAETTDSLESQYEALAHLKKWGLPVVDEVTTCRNFDEIWKFAQNIESERPKLPFEIDGIVVKVDDLKSQKKLGVTGKNVRWAVAYKYSAEQAETKIHAITVQVGRTGVLTPVAELDPVTVSGSTISRATLHNEDEVARKDIRVGDTVLVEKGGDVIPKVVSVNLKKRTSVAKPWRMPATCPACGALAVRTEGEVAVRCPNKEGCPAQELARVIFFCSKGGMDIEFLGQKHLEQLAEKGFVRRPSDIYRLTEDDLHQLRGFKEKSVHNLLSSIEQSKSVPLPRFLMALGIKYVGAETAELLAKYAGSIEALYETTEEALIEIEGIGAKVAESVVTFFSDPENRQEIEELLHLGVNPQVLKVKRFIGHSFQGKTFVLTGALEGYTRDEARSLIKERGGKVSGSVSKNTDFLLVGDEPGSKYDKAKQLGVELLDEKTFTKLLG